LTTEAEIVLEARDLAAPIAADEEIHAVNGVSLTVRRGEFISCTDPRALQDHAAEPPRVPGQPQCRRAPPGRPEHIRSGEHLGERRLTRIRRELFGYVFQSFNLIPPSPCGKTCCSRLPSTASPGWKGGRQVADPARLGHRLHHLRADIGGEMQRVAIARALINAPRSCLPMSPPETSTQENG